MLSADGGGEEEVSGGRMKKNDNALSGLSQDVKSQLLLENK